MSEVLGRLDRTIAAQGPDSLLVDARDALHQAYATISELREDSATWRRRCGEETRAWVRADSKAQSFDQIVQTFRESVDPDDGIVNDPQDLFDLIDGLARAQESQPTTIMRGVASPSGFVPTSEWEALEAGPQSASSEDVAKLITNAREYVKRSRAGGAPGPADAVELLTDALEVAVRAVPPVETVNTVEELDALPVGSIVRKPPEESERIEYEDGSWEQGAVAEKRLGRGGRPAWFLVGSELGWRSHQVDLIGARVLFRPDTEGSTS